MVNYKMQRNEIYIRNTRNIILKVIIGKCETGVRRSNKATLEQMMH